MPCVGEDFQRGQSRTDNADVSGESGWVATDVAARALRVSPRTIRRYIDQDKLEAKPQGEGVRREWLVSVDSLHALRASRTIEEAVSEEDRAFEYADSFADIVREMTARLERRAEEAAELRVRLELTERAQSTLEDERRQALQELEDERRRRAEAERERDDLRRQLEASGDERESPETVEAEQELGTERARHQMAESTMREGMDEERWRREEAEREHDDLRRELSALRRRQRESPQTAPEAPEGAEPRSYAPGTQEATQRPQGGGLRGLRRRILGW
jgi:colicin import membrane protein